MKKVIWKVLLVAGAVFLASPLLPGRGIQRKWKRKSSSRAKKLSP